MHFPLPYFAHLILNSPVLFLSVATPAPSLPYSPPFYFCSSTPLIILPMLDVLLACALSLGCATGLCPMYCVWTVEGLLDKDPCFLRAVRIRCLSSASCIWCLTTYSNSWQGIYLPLGDYLHLSSSQMSNFRWNPFSKMAVWLPLWTLFAEKGVFRFVSMMPSDQKYLGCITVWEHHEAQFKIQFSYYLVAWSSKVDCSMCVH